ncbi:MAG TPA: TolC family protein [Chthonomonadaceae bacterium]|nr:TolC family protein [Chthonomonadaceae bacterium]
MGRSHLQQGPSALLRATSVTRNRGRSSLSAAFILGSILFEVAACGQTPPIGSAVPSGGNLAKLLAARPVLNQGLTLDQAVAIALKESPVVRGAAEEVQAAIGRVNAARAETRPWLSANTFLSGGSNSNIVASPSATQPQMLMALPRDAFFDQNLMLMFPLYTGGRLEAAIRQAAAMRNASQADLAAQRQEVALMTRAAYREVLARQALVGVAQARLKENQERLRVDQEKFSQGAVPLVTVRRDEAETAAAQQEVINAQRDVDLALVELKTVMGVHPASRLDLTDTNAYQPSADFLKALTAGVAVPNQETALSPELAALLALAERQRPELQAAAQRVRGAQADIAGAQSAFLPQVNLFAMGDFQKGRYTASFLGTTYGLVASLPLYNGGQRHAHIQTADAERRRQEQDREQVALQVAQEVQNALLNLHAAEQNIQTARTAQTAAEEGYRVALQRYEAGRSVVVEVLDALAARTQAESGLVQALFQYNVAQDQLLRAVGGLENAALDVKH